MIPTLVTTAHRGAARRRFATAGPLAPASGLLFPLLLLLLWHHGSATGWISPQTLPSPRESWTAFVHLLGDGSLGRNLAVSLWRVTVGFAIGALVGLLLGIVMGLSKTMEECLYPTFKALSYVPLLGWVPLFMLLVGIGDWLKFLLIAKAALVPVTLNSFRGFSGAPAAYRELAATYGLSRLQYLRHILLPYALPAIWTGLRYGLTYAWLVLVVVELIASSEGVGYMMINAQQLYQLDVVVVGIAIIGLVGFLLDRSLAAIEARLMRWRPEAFR